MRKLLLSDGFKISFARRGALLLLLLTLLSSSINAANLFDTQTRSFVINNKTLQQAIEQILENSGYYVVYSLDNVQSLGNVTLELKNSTTEEALQKVLASKGLTFSIKDNNVIISKVQVEQPKLITVKGRVLDANTNKPIAGATVIVIGKTSGAITDDKGEFSFKAAIGEVVEVSFTGMVTVNHRIAGEQPMEIKMQNDAIAVEDVVVTGYANKAKNSFTGSAVTVGREQLKSIGQRNILSALSNFVPGMELLVDNRAGSDPNKKPDILIRGRSSLLGANNSPTFILDGMEITLDEVFDLNMEDVENITVLKDASASALYGARAANGVIVITSKRLEVSKLRVAYNLDLKVSAPDLSDYNLLNSAQKLDYEKRAGIYDATSLSGQYILDELYNKRYKEMRRGVDTYWLAAPLHTAVSHSHSLNIYGGSDNVRYMMNARYGDDVGLMKGSSRERYGINFRLSYNINQKIFFQNYVSISGNKSTESPYGTFGKYTMQNPYDRMENEDGTYQTGLLSSGVANPLLEATFGSYDTGKGMTIADNFELKWNILEELVLEAKFSISSTTNQTDKFISPKSATFISAVKSERGSYNNNFSTSGRYESSLFVNYNKQFGAGTLLYLLGGVNLSQNTSDSKGMKAYGFYSDKLDHISFATGYSNGSKPSGSLSRDRMLGFALNANYIMKDRYFVDASFRSEGSSKYGRDDRFSTFWTAGLGWNIHKENFLKNSAINNFKLRGSVGQNGNNSFDPYQAVTTYQFSQDLIYKYGMGANPINIGNPNLQWERKMTYSAGIDFALKDNVVDFTFEYYQAITDNLLVDINKAPSTGVLSAKENLGKTKNEGVEARINIRLLKTKDIYWTMSAMASHNKNTILKIGNALKKLNEERNAQGGIAPLQTYEEGESTSSLRVVPSAGINPADGREIFIKKDGSLTYIYDYNDKINVGDTSPFAYGTLGTNITYKQWTLSIMGGYRMGATIYNETLATRVEGANPKRNADIRVFSQRWKNPGDVVRYKDIKDTTTPNHTDRFVEDQYEFTLNNLQLSYQFKPEFCRKLRMQNIRLSLYANDLAVFSTVGQERGLDYPFARNFQFSLSVTF